MTWTIHDEATLQCLQEKKAEYINMNRDCVERAIHWYDNFSERAEVVEGLISHATVIRKVLEPFDEEFGK